MIEFALKMLDLLEDGSLGKGGLCAWLMGQGCNGREEPIKCFTIDDNREARGISLGV